MKDLYKNKYRRQTTRAPFWNYGWPAAYFITICTDNRQSFFGCIQCTEDGDIDHQLSAIGDIVKAEWLRTPNVRPQMNILLDEFIVMPDHFHGIMIIRPNSINAEPLLPGNQVGRQSNNLPSVVRGFKSAVTIGARKFNTEFKWQTGYYETIITDDDHLNRVRDYIHTNPLRWSRSDQTIQYNPPLC